MGKYKFPPKVKVFVGLLAGKRERILDARATLGARLGPEEEVMEPVPFTWTRFYEKELGSSPLRAFVSYESRIEREELVEIKRWTNEVEARTAEKGRRSVNLDPGYMTLGQVFLASTKDQRWRVYLGGGVFVEATLYFQDGAFHPFPWTYRDYRSAQYAAFFLRARAKLAYQHRHGGRPFSRRASPDAA